MPKLEDALPLIEHVRALAECFNDIREGEITIGPTDAGLAYIALRYLEKLMNAGLVDPTVKV